MQIYLFLVSLLPLAFSQCCLYCDSSYCSVPCTLCSTGYSLIGNLLCVEACPTNSIFSSTPTPTCSSPSGQIFLIDFTSQKDLTAKAINGFLTPSNLQFADLSQNTPLPTLDRGFYFAASSSIKNSNNFIPGYLFTMNIWIFPITSGVIFKTKIGTLEYIIIEILSGNYKISLLSKNPLNSGINDLVSFQGSGIINTWEPVTFQYTQATYNSIGLQIIINNNPTSFTISNREANFPNGNYDWVIGDPVNSFQGFIYWIQANSGSTIYFPAISPPVCLNSKWWDGSNCRSCGSCQNWPWCIRSENCLICKSLDCLVCNGYETSMCTSCNTGVIPGCCDALCDTCSQTWSCSACKAGKLLINGICLNSCPYGFGSCSLNTGILISADFNVPFSGTYGIFITGTDSSSYQFFNLPETVDPVPSQNRGLYFSSGKYLIGSIDLSHTFTISLWIRPESGDILGNSYGDLKFSSSGLVTLLLKSWDNTATITLSNSVSIITAAWKYLSFSVNFSNKQTTIIVYSNNSPSLPSSIIDFVFRPNSNDKLFIGKSISSNYNGFVSYFKLWGGVISDFSGEMGDGGCGTGNGISCLWNCGFLFWGSACTACDGGCTFGCVLNGNCNICNDNLCGNCSSFNTGSCSQCIEHATGAPCACNTGYYPNYTLQKCEQCDNSCSACSGPGYYSCTACPTGTYLLKSICMTTCPSQYTQDTTLHKCVQVSDLVASLAFNGIILLDAISTFKVGSVNTNLYPIYDTNDPIPSYNRGYYFKSTSYLASTGNYMSPFFALNFWVYTVASGTLFRKSSTTTYILISIASGTNYASVSLTLSNGSTMNLLGISSMINNWKYLSIIGSAYSGNTNLKIYINNAIEASSTSASQAYLYDLGDMYIGKSSGGIAGFLWSFSAYNDENKYSIDWNAAGCGGTPCPYGIVFPMCPFSSYLDTSTSTCMNCLSGCTGGCINSISCGLCKMPACYSCLSFSGPCTSCVSNASPDGNGGCACNDSYFWNPDTLICDFCDKSCKVCLGTTYFECSVCYSAYTLAVLACLGSCPYGFGAGCSPVSTPVINELFNTGLQTTYGVFKNKMDTNRLNFFKTLDSNDAITPVQKGLFINEAIYLETSAVRLFYDVALGIWVNTITHGNLATFYSSFYNYDFVLSTDGSLLYQLTNKWRTKYKFTTPTQTVPSDAWNYLSFTVNYVSNRTTIQVFVNGNQVYHITKWNYLLRQVSTSVWRINAYNNCFVGYIYSFQFWNALVSDFSSWINNNICGAGLKSTCLYTYTSAQYNNSTSCAACDSSLTGCVRNILCNQCDDPLCASCTNFSPGKCTKCVGNSAGAPSKLCACNDGYFTKYDYICSQCNTGCRKCLNFFYNSCTSCFTGYYLYSGMCLSACPDGYITNSSTNTCDSSGSGTYFLDFYGLIKLDTIGSLTVGNSNTNKYPDYDTNDPLPAINRGYYFSGNSSVSTPFMLGTSFTISIWIKALDIGFVFMKYVSDSIIQIKINSSGQGYVNCTLYTFWITTRLEINTTSSLLNSWNFLSATASLCSDVSQISNMNVYGSTTLATYVNGIADGNAITAVLSYVADSSSGLVYIGSDQTMNNGFKGFISKISIYPDSLSYGLDYANSGCNGSCSKCPSSLMCLSECLINAYPGTSCGNCLPACIDGCINGLTCRLCKQSTCLSCEEFAGDCFSCISNAYLEDGSCYCDTDAYFNETTQICQTCSTAGYFQCTACNTAIGKLCIRECPYGFTSPHCKNVTTPVIDQTFYGDFAGNYGIFITGTSANTYQFWNSPESFDPIPSYKRGLYFSPGQYLQSSIEVYLSHSFSIGVWVYQIAPGYIIYKETYVSLASNGILKILLEDLNEATTLFTSTTTLPNNAWNYISFTVVSSITTTSITLYANTVAITPVTANSKIFRDQMSKSLYIGKSSTADFKGFIYWFTLWNVPITDFSLQVNNLCGVGLGKNCLWACDINSYYTGVSCSGCNSCSLGCRRSQNCNICYDQLCAICSGFDSAECIICVSNATPQAGICACNANYIPSADGFSCIWGCYSGCASCLGTLNTQCTSCLSGWYLYNNECLIQCPAGWTEDSDQALCTNCYDLCSHCIGSLYTQCISCKSGYFKIQSFCGSFCPTGYITNGNICELNTNDGGFVFHLKPHQIKNKVVDLQNSIQILTGKDNNFYPNYDTTDPIAAINRGYYFTGVSYMQLPPYSGTSSPLLIFSPQFIIATWIRPISGSGIIFCKQTDNGAFTKYVSLELINNYPSLTLTLKDSSAVAYTSSNPSLKITLTQWVFISAASGLSSTPQQTISLTVNLFSTTSNDLGASWLEDLESSFLITIGVCHLDSTHFSSFFNGFLWDLKIYNTLNTPALTQTSCNGCSLCPIDNSNICLDNCQIDSYWNGNICVSCLSECSSTGCVRKDKNCNLCQDVICEVCDDYTSVCIVCKSNASLIGSSCKCNDGFYWDIDNESCDACYESCKACISSNSLDCLACSNGFYLFSGICLSSCPLGYFSTGSKCLQAREQIFDLDLNTLEGVIYDKANSIPVVTGSTKQFYPNYENDDPIPAYLRGFYFNGKSSLLRMPEYLNYTSPKLVIAPIFTISIWLNPEAPFSAIMSKHEISDSSAIWAVYLINSSPALFLVMNSSPYLYTCQTLLNEYKWNHIAFTLEITNDRNSEVSCYVNSVLDSSAIAMSRYFKDIDLKTTMIIGAQASPETLYNFFKGFIYSIQIFNAIESINKLSTTICTENCGICPTNNICIPNCKINEYWSGPSYNACYRCNINCSKSCRNWRPTCSLCNDLLCKECINYSAAGCIDCKENAINTDSCICDVNYVLDTSNNSTCIPFELGGFKGSDGNFYSCPSLCTSCKSLIECIACIENASISNGLCYCNLGYNGTNICTLVEFTAKLTVLDDNSLYLIFSESLVNRLEIYDFTITIKNQEVSWKMEQINNTCYYISLSFEETISSGTLATLEFLNLTELRSVSNGVLNSSELLAYFNYYESAPYSSTIEGITSQITAGVQSAVSIAAVLSLVNPSPSSLWSLMNTLQILSYLTLSGIPLSSKMSAFLNSLNSFNLFPNAFIFFIDENKGHTPYSQAKNFGFDTDLILINQGSSFTLILLSISAFPIVLLFSRCSYRWFGKKFKKTMISYKYGFYLRFWIQSYLDLGAAASIALVAFSRNNSAQIINIILCLLAYLFLVCTPPLYFLFSYRNKKRIQSGEKTFHLLFNTFFYEFRTDKGLLATQYYLIFFTRRLIYIINLVYLRDYPETEVTINIVLSLITIMHLLFCWPFIDPILQINNLLTEILVFIIMISSSIYLFNIEQGIMTLIESFMVIIVVMAIAIQFCSSLAIFSRTLYQVIRHKYGKIAMNDKNPTYKAVN